LLWGDPVGQGLVGALGVVDVIEEVDLSLQLAQAAGERLLVEPPEQGLVESLVLALGGRLARLAGDGLGSQGSQVGDQLALVSAS